MRQLAERLSKLPGVIAVTLGGSRAMGTARQDSDSDLALYYRGDFSAEDVRALGFEGTVVEPGEWGRILNGGARVIVDGQRVEVLYRRLDAVEHWLAEAQAGRFEIDHVEGRVAGLPTYVLVGELATCEMLGGELPRPSFPEALRRNAPPRWRSLAALDLDLAAATAERGDVATCVGLLAQAAIAEAHARLAERGEWGLSESGIARRAGLAGKVTSTLAAAGDRPFELSRSVSAMRVALRGPLQSG